MNAVWFGRDKNDVHILGIGCLQSSTKRPTDRQIYIQHKNDANLSQCHARGLYSDAPSLAVIEFGNGRIKYLRVKQCAAMCAEKKSLGFCDLTFSDVAF